MNEGATRCVVATACALIATIKSSYFFLLNSGKAAALLRAARNDGARHEFE